MCLKLVTYTNSSKKSYTYDWIGPPKLQGILDDSSLLVSDWQGKLLLIKIHANRINPYRLNLEVTENGKLRQSQMRQNCLREINN